ncbi:MAG: DUF2795 domain-containing protein [Pseudonocardiaceae bacterium]|nr:DUF2795 domain-containing protein [Pseudonocardiaceae bacterium]
MVSVVINVDSMAGAVPVTRFEILDAVEGAFVRRPVTKSELLESARDAGARVELLATLNRLRDRRFSNARDLWADLEDVPVDR